MDSATSDARTPPGASADNGEGVHDVSRVEHVRNQYAAKTPSPQQELAL
ncbi:hypothetical protein LXH13_22935 [Streptomyces spinosirectus]|nr:MULTISPECIES: hypothetical protein [Streptomyces]MBY8339895.1 hypothetical protein [Streptomyces plumbidurans]UIR19718.1 hypothetical protein LXH13_22935 [Streptomyces spinosirectus]